MCHIHPKRCQVFGGRLTFPVVFGFAVSLHRLRVWSERNNQLIEREPFWNGLRGADAVDRKRGAGGFGAVEVFGAVGFTGHAESVYFVGQAVGSKGGWAIHQLKMQMRRDGVSGVADQPEDLATFTRSF